MKNALSFVNQVAARFLLITLFFVSFFGVFFCTKMMTMDMGMLTINSNRGALTSDCGALPNRSTCPMNLDQHLATWAQYFAAAFTGDLLAILFIAITLIVISTVSLIILSASPLSEFLRRYLRQHRQLKLYNTLIELFASGILRPKLFA